MKTNAGIKKTLLICRKHSGRDKSPLTLTREVTSGEAPFYNEVGEGPGVRGV
jgi:hypothetical protein